MLTSAQVEAVEKDAIEMLTDPNCAISRTKLDRFVAHCIDVRTALINVESRARLDASRAVAAKRDQF